MCGNWTSFLSCIRGTAKNKMGLTQLVNVLHVDHVDQKL